MEIIYRQMARNKIVVFLFFIALISGFFWNQKMFSQPIGSDQIYYDGIASDILNHGRFTFEGQDVFIEPFYPLFLAGIYAIFGHNYDAVRIIQIILFALTAVLKDWHFSVLWPLILAAATLCSLVIFLHRANITRLLSGTEHKIFQNGEKSS